MALQSLGTLRDLSPPSSQAAAIDSTPSLIGPITLGTKRAGARSAGNPHAACDEEGAGNGIRAQSEAPALGESCRQRLIPVPNITAPALDPTGNDVSSRDIEGANPLYLPQAKTYNGSCAIGPVIMLASPDEMRDLTIQAEIIRDASPIFTDQIRTSQMKRSLEELATFLGRELDFPEGVFLMTGTGIVPPDGFSLQPGDVVRISIASLTLENGVEG